MTATVRGFGLLQTTGSTGTFTVPVPSGVVKGDLLIAMIARTGSDQHSPGGEFNPEGWQLLASETGSNVGMSWYMKRARETEPSTYAWTLASGTTGCVASIIAIKEPGAMHVFAKAEGSDTSAVCPDVTTTKECIVLRAFLADDNDITEDTGHPAGTTLLWVRESSGSGTADKCGGASWELLPAGATGTAAFTLDSTEGWTAVTIAIETESLQASSASTVDLNRRKKPRPLRSR